MKITVFSTITCPYCKMVKEFLKSKGLLFDEKMVDQDFEAKNEMMALSDGYLGVPFTHIIKDDGTEVKIIGFDKKAFEEKLSL